MAWYQGPCRITVTDVGDRWPQRAVVTVQGRTVAVIPGTIGASEHIDAASFDLAVEHRFEGDWQPNVRALTGRWQETGGTRSQLVTSVDRDGRDGSGRSLGLRIERVGEDRPAPAARAAAAVPAAGRTTTHSADRGRTSDATAGRPTTSGGGSSSTGSSSSGAPGTGSSGTGSSGTVIPRATTSGGGGGFLGPTR
ncbi:hypothetical protein OH807_03075 [Kitasatospora sp. NBC_01560]|uniref:hypothetical protein n=1 Tax=Kitasatospora sp. NBC_01560 TaxID=2975965 RepID=UPI0038708659